MMMKISMTTASALIALMMTSPSTVSTTDAFTPSILSSSKPNTALRYSYASDNIESLLVEEAMQISKKFGSSSPQAKTAWEAVDEVVHASDMQNEVTKKGLDEECTIDLDHMVSTTECMDYAEKLYKLEQVIGETKSTGEELQRTTLDIDSIPKIQLQESTSTSIKDHKSVPQHPDVRVEIEEATFITDKYGIHSSEARVAWEAVEELSSSLSHHEQQHKNTAAKQTTNEALNALNRILLEQIM
jgi:hypothetical protein